MIGQLGSGHDQEQMEAHINMMIKIQSAIDVIDQVTHEESARQDSEVECRVGGRIPVPSGSS